MHCSPDSNEPAWPVSIFTLIPGKSIALASNALAVGGIATAYALCPIPQEPLSVPATASTAGVGCVSLSTSLAFGSMVCAVLSHQAFCVHPGRLDAELLNVTKRVTNVLQMLPKNITPVNLEELRRVKQQLVELESRAENIV